MLNSVSNFFLKYNIIIILVIIVFWGGFLRLYNLGEQSLWIDEGYTINASQAILEHGYPILDSGASYNAHMFHNYITAGSMKLFNFTSESPWSARLPAAIFGILSIFAIYLFTIRVTKNNLTALSASFLMSFSYWEIAWSRQARGYTDMQFFILLSFTFFYNWLEYKKTRDGILTIIFLILSYLSHGVALIFIPAFFVIFLIHIIYSGKIKEYFSISTISFFVILASFTTWIVLKILPPIVTYSYASNYTSFFTNELKYISLIAFTILIGLFFGKNIFWRIIYIISIILPTTIIIVFYSQVVQIRYLLTIFPFLLVAVSYGLYLIVIKKEYIKMKYRIIIYFIIVIGISYTITTFIPKSMYNLETGSPQPNFKKGYTIIKNLKKENDIIISPYTHLSKIYLNDSGLWLPTSLTGRTTEISANTVNGGDYYTGAPIIPNKEALLNILDTKSGYIVLDGMARFRLKELFTTIIQHPRITPLYFEENEKKDVIAIYQFRPKPSLIKE